MGFRSFARSLRPGNDQQLAVDLSAQRRRSNRRSVPRAARQGQTWEDADRQQERQRRGPYAQ